MEWLWETTYQLSGKPLRVVPTSSSSDYKYIQISNHPLNLTSDRRHLYDVVAELLKIGQTFKLIGNWTLEDLNQFRSECEYKDWEVIMWRRDEKEDYTGLAFLVPSIGSIVVIHSLNCTEENLLRRFHKMLNDESKYCSIDLAATFVQQVIDRTNELEFDPSVKLVIAGHRLGGWLAQISYLTGSYLRIIENAFQKYTSCSESTVQCVSFDSPGCLEAVIRLKEQYSINSDDLPLPMIYLTAPSLLNTLGKHWGYLYRIFPEGSINVTMSHPFNAQIKLSTAVTGINTIQNYLRNENTEKTLEIHQWPTVFNLDYEDEGSIQTLGPMFTKETADEAAGIKRIEKTFSFRGIDRRYVVGSGSAGLSYDDDAKNLKLLQNVYVRFSNSNLISMFRLLGSDYTKLMISEHKINGEEHKRLKRACDSGSKFILSPLPKMSFVQSKAYNLVYEYESLQDVIDILLRGHTLFLISECYKSVENDGSCVVVLKSNTKGLVMLSGLNSCYVDKIMIQHHEINNLTHMINPDTEDGNKFSNTINTECIHIFEYLCRTHSDSSLVWFHARKGNILLKCFYDKCLRIERNYDDNSIGDLLNRYDTILLYGEAGSGKTREIHTIINKINSWVIYIRLIELTADDINELFHAFEKGDIKYLVKRFLVFHQEDEKLVSLVLKKCLYQSNVPENCNLLICFDGMDSYKSEGTSKKFELMKNLLMSVLKTRAKVIITARSRTDYLNEIEKNINSVPSRSQTLGTGKIGMMKECELKKILTHDYLIFNKSELSKISDSDLDQINPDTLYNSLSRTLDSCLPFISTSMILEVSLASLTPLMAGNEPVVPDNACDFFEVIINKHVSDILMENKGKYFDEEESKYYVDFLFTLKQCFFYDPNDLSAKEFIFDKFLSLQRGISKGGHKDEPMEGFLSFWKKASDCMLEFFFAQNYLNKTCNRRVIYDTDCLKFNKMMECSEYNGMISILNQLLCTVEPLPTHSEILIQNVINNYDWKKETLLKLIKDKRIHIIRFFSHILAYQYETGENALHLAAEEGNEEVASIFLRIKKEMLSGKFENGHTPLHVAVLKGHEKVVAKLIDEGANREDQDKDGNTPLHLAAKYKFDNLDQEVLKNKHIIDMTNGSEDTSLNLSARSGTINIVDYLLQGANIEKRNRKDFTPLLTAVQTGCLDIVEKLIERGAATGVKSIYGFSAIHYAAANNSINIINLLVKTDVNILRSTSSKYNFTAMHIAAANGHLDAVKLLLDLEAKVNTIDNKIGFLDSKDSKDRIPLHFAASMGRKDIVEYLLEKGSKKNSLCKDKYTPLHMAAKNGHHDVVRVLLNNGAGLSTCNFRGLTPIESAAHKIQFADERLHDLLIKTIEVFLENPNFNNNLVESLLFFSLRHDLNIPDWLYQRLLERTNAQSERTKEDFHSIHFAAYRCDISTIQKLKYKIISFDVNSKSSKGYTPLYISVIRKSDNEINNWIQWGADVSVHDENKINPLHLACYHGKLPVIDALVERNRNLIDQPTANGSTPLHLAAHSGYRDVVTRLVTTYKASLQLKDNKHYTPLHIATFFGRLDIVQFIVDSTKETCFLNDQTSDGSTSLNLAARRGKVKILKLLMDSGADPDVADKKGFTPLHNAAYQNNVEIVQYLLKKERERKEKRGNESVNSTTSSGSTPLFLAVKQGCDKSVSILLEYDADVNFVEKNGLTPLHLAALTGKKDILEKLIKHKGNVNVSDKVGRTPLFLASMEGHKQTSEMLIEKDADIKISQNKGWGPIHAAVHKSQFDVVTLLVQKGGYECINSRTDCGDVALHFAAWIGDSKLMKWLVQNGTECGVMNKFGITPADLAISQGHVHPEKCPDEQCEKCLLYNYLLDNGQNVEFMKDFKHMNKIECEVMRKNCLKTVEYLVNELKADFLYYSSKSNLTPVHAAAKFNCTEILKYLHRQDNDLNIVIPELNETPLYVAVVNREYESVRTLVELGVGINLGDQNGWTPLHAAVFKNYPKIVKYLCLLEKCNKNAGTDWGMTPLYLGAQYNCFEAVKELFPHHVDPTIADRGGMNPLKVVEHNLQQLTSEQDAVSEKYKRTVEMLSLIKDYTEKWAKALDSPK